MANNRVEALFRAVTLPVAGIAFACTPSAPANEALRPTNQPITQELTALATAVPCDPETYARTLNLLPTPVSVGDSAASPEIVRITSKLYRCEALSEIEQAAIRKLNEEHPLLATPDPAKDPARQLAPASTGAPAPELAKKPENIPQENLIQRLAVYGVYHGNLLDEANKPIGEILVNRLPDHEKRGRQVWIVTHITEPCSDGSRKAPSETLSERDIKEGELVSDFRPRAIKVRIPNQSTVNGELLLRAVGVCPPKDLKTHFEILFVGQGLDVLTRYATAMNQRLGVTATPEYIQKSLEAAYGGPLPQ